MSNCIVLVLSDTTCLFCRPAVVDTPELRAQFIREMLLSAFEIDKGL